MIRLRSIETKVALLIGGLLLMTAGAFGALALRIATRSASSSVAERLRTVANQIGAPSGNSLQQRLEAMQRLADTVPLVRIVVAGVPPGDSAALAKLLGPLGADTAEIANVGLLDRTGRALFWLRTPPTDADDAEITPAKGDSIVVTSLLRAGADVFYEVRAPVHQGRALVGHLVQRRKVVATQETIARLVELVGFESTFLVGNADGSLWTDFRQIVERPPVTVPRGAPEHYEVGGVPVIRVAVPLSNTPLTLAIETPISVVDGQARVTLRPLFLAGAILVLLGSIVGWWLGRKLTRPLVQLTHAAEAIADGSSIPVPRLPQRDEIGRLSDSIATMADRLLGEQARLESQVAEQTLALREALERLRDTQAELVRKERFAILGHLSSGVGHELRNPLGVMTNAVYFLEASLPEAPAKIKEYFGVLRDQIRLSEKIVSDLLDFARVKPPEREVIAVADIFDAQLGRTTIPPGIRLERDLAEGLPPVEVDAVQVGQVVLNLLINAVQAMGDRPGVLRLVARSENGTVDLRVEDTGPGIHPESLEQVFEPLFTTKARGIGLGLSVSRALALNNEGTLTAANRPEGGASFRLTLNAARRNG